MPKKPSSKRIATIVTLVMALSLTVAGFASKTITTSPVVTGTTPAPGVSAGSANSPGPAGTQPDAKIAPATPAQVEEKQPAAKESALVEPAKTKPPVQVPANDGGEQTSAIIPPAEIPTTTNPAPPVGETQARPEPVKEALPEDYNRNSSSGGIDVSVTWLTTEYYAAVNSPVPPEVKEYMGQYLVFGVSLTTHQGDLSTFDMAGNTTVSVNGKQSGQVAWKWLAQDSHHPDGLLLVPLAAGTEVKSIQMSIKNLGDAAGLKFNWDR